MAVKDCKGSGGHRSVNFLELLKAIAEQDIIFGSRSKRRKVEPRLQVFKEEKNGHL